jgi:hypothetical protein
MPSGSKHDRQATLHLSLRSRSSSSIHFSQYPIWLVEKWPIPVRPIPRALGVSDLTARDTDQDPRRLPRRLRCVDLQPRHF